MSSGDDRSGLLVVESQQHIPAHSIMRNGKPYDGFFSHENTSVVSIDLYNNVIFDSSTSMLWNSNEPIGRTKYLIDDYSLRLLEEKSAIDLSSAGLVCIGYNRAGRVHNHYHWLNQCLPAIRAYSTIGCNEKPIVLLPNSINYNERRAIELAGVDMQFLFLDDTTRVFLSQAAFCTYLVGAADYRPSYFSKQLFDEIAEKTRKMPFSKTGSRIYVSRQDAIRRPLLNEAEVVGLMSTFGFSILKASEMTIDEQICAFSRADIVVGPHGAGLTNIVFCRKNCIVIELANEKNINPCFVNMSYLGEFNYFIETSNSNSIPVEEDGHNQGWLVDIQRLKTLLHQVIPLSIKHSQRWSLPWPRRR